MKSILYIGNKLSKHGNTPTSIETLGSFLEKEGYTLLYASEKQNQILRFLDMGYSVLKYRNKVDYVVIDTYSTFSFWYAFMVSQLCRFFSIKYIPMLRGGNLPYRLDKTPKLSKMIFDYSYKNIAPSGYLMHAFEIRNFFNLLFIPNTINISNYTFYQNRDYSVPKLLWVRSFAGLYNPKMAIDVLKKVQKKYPTATLCMVGPDKDGSLETTRTYAEQQNVSVVFTGGLPKEKWIDLSKEYNVFINTTHFDNTPVSVIEALCLGLPVITTNVGGIPFLLESYKNAVLVEDGDSEAMSNAVLELIQDEETRNALSQNGRKYVEGFDWEAVKKQWEQVFNGQD